MYISPYILTMQITTGMCTNVKSAKYCLFVVPKLSDEVTMRWHLHHSSNLLNIQNSIPKTKVSANLLSRCWACVCVCVRVYQPKSSGNINVIDTFASIYKCRWIIASRQFSKRKKNNYNNNNNSTVSLQSENPSKSFRMLTFSAECSINFD